MSSNIKPKSQARESPTEPFKRAVTGCLRAIARKADLDVAFAAERPGLVGGKARLPEPPRKLSRQEAAIMRGLASNLTAMLDDRFHRGKFDEITDRADAPIEDAVAMLVRERLTGQAPPAAAKKIVDLWRGHIEERAGRDLDRLEKLIEDQRKFGDVVHDLLESLE